MTVGFVEQIIEKERPDGIMLSFGGQTALNCGVELWQKGILKQYNVKVLGTSVETIMAAEDRDLFKEKLEEIGEKLAPSIACENIADAVEAAKSIGYPVIVRAAFALGGLGSGFADTEAELLENLPVAFSTSPQVCLKYVPPPPYHCVASRQVKKTHHSISAQKVFPIFLQITNTTFRHGSRFMFLLGSSPYNLCPNHAKDFWSCD